MSTLIHQVNASPVSTSAARSTPMPKIPTSVTPLPRVSRRNGSRPPAATARSGAACFLGVRDNQAVAARGNSEPSRQPRQACPKGLSEHHILSAPGRAKTALLRKNGVLTPVSWDEALDTMVERFRDYPAALWQRVSRSRLVLGQLLTEEFYTLGKLVQLGLRTRNHDATPPSAGLPRSPLQTVVRLRRPAWLLRRHGVRRRHPPSSRQYCGQPPHPLPPSTIAPSPGTKHASSSSSIRAVTKLHDGRTSTSGRKPRSDIALLMAIAHILIRESLIDRDYNRPAHERLRGGSLSSSPPSLLNTSRL